MGKRRGFLREAWNLAWPYWASEEKWSGALREAEWRPTIVSVGHHSTLRRFHDKMVDLGRHPVGAVAAAD